MQFIVRSVLLTFVWMHFWMKFKNCLSLAECPRNAQYSTLFTTRWPHSGCPWVWKRCSKESRRKTVFRVLHIINWGGEHIIFRWKCERMKRRKWLFLGLQFFFRSFQWKIGLYLNFCGMLMSSLKRKDIWKKKHHYFFS